MPSASSAETGRSPGAEQLPAELIEILRCPTTGAPLRQQGAELVTVEAEGTGGAPQRYRIEHGVAHLLPTPRPDQGHNTV